MGRLIEMPHLLPGFMGMDIPVFIRRMNDTYRKTLY
jgi:hypothetical protein